MKHLNVALVSSLQGLALDPEDPIGKQLMARVRSKNIFQGRSRERGISFSNFTQY